MWAHTGLYLYASTPLLQTRITVGGFTSSELVWLQMNVNKLWMDRLCLLPVLDCYWQRLLTPNQQLATYQYSEQSHMFGLLGMACLTTMWMICNPSGRGCWRAADISQRYIKRWSGLTAQLVVQVLRQLLHDEDWFAADGCISCSRICQSNWTSIR